MENIVLSYINIYDTHIHSIHSFDGNHTCSKMCEGAIANGAKGICITDHCDIDMKDYDFDALVKNQYKDIQLAKEQYGDKLEILFGLELGQGTYKEKEALDFISRYDYDFILGSIHNLRDKEDFYFMDFKNEDIDELLNEYFNELLNLVKWNKADSLAHLTYPFRYMIDSNITDISYNNYLDIIDEIFETLIKNKKALELNTSGLFMKMNETLPSKELIKRFHDMGGEYVTVGSDSHYYNKVCNGIQIGLDILKDCGYDCYTVFKNREPIFVPIK